jgi:transposase
LNGEAETGESYFGKTRKGKRGREASGKVAVFGLLQKGGKVCAAIASNARTETLLPMNEEKVSPGSIVYTDMFKACNALDVTNFHHNANQAKRRLRGFNCIKPGNFHWFLKECEWRVNGDNHQSRYKKA